MLPMREDAFISKNMARWRRIEMQVASASFASTDEMVEIYTDISSDLAYAQTHFPQSAVWRFLNNLTLELHGVMYRKRHPRWHRLLTYWTHDVPLAVYDGRRELRLSLVVFAVGLLFGMLSALGGEEYMRILLGDAYMDQTLHNISTGQPMAIYDGGPATTMFLHITVNNVWVAFLCFAMGIFTSFATGYLILHNAMIVGAFITFFAQRGLLFTALPTIMLHGTLELSAIIIAGGAGMALGNGWLFPGTYTRVESFVRAARRAVQIVVSTVPIFIVAGFIEGFFTRYTDVGDLPRLFVIFLSLAFIVFYYILLPINRHRHAT